jgi:diguanylate cyclase (GGDEF)-like protein
MNGTVQDITEQKRMEEALRRRIDTEKILANISTRFVKFADFDNAIRASLADIGQLSGACRVCLFQFCESDGTMDNSHEWCEKGVMPEIKHLQTAMFPWWVKNLHANTVLYLPDVSKMPPEAAREREFLERQSIQSVLALPLYIEERLQGFIRLDNIIPIAEGDISLLRIASEIIGSALARRQTEALINHLAYHDTLTNLPNRNLLQDRLQMAIIQAKRINDIVAVMFLDLDSFKSINDTLGHHVGDLLLKAVADRLTWCIRKGDTVARMGGDEFMVILPDLGHALNAATIANKIIYTLQQPFSICGYKLSTTASIGISIYPLDADDKDSLIKQADIAMYLAKEQGKNTYRFYNVTLNTRIS